ncbi:MAG: hypothetical protein LAT67_08590 [Balneolales bacterium]|nr:hypothetical protein [Balneolales bacterium]
MTEPNFKDESELERLFHQYLNGELSQEAEDQLWAFLVENPEHHKSLKISASLYAGKDEILASINQTASGQDQTKMDEQETEKPTHVSVFPDKPESSGSFDLSLYTPWLVAVAAVLVLVIGLNLLKISSDQTPSRFMAIQSEPLEYTIPEIDALFFENVIATRDSGTDEEIVHLLDAALLAAFSDNSEDALAIFHDVIRNYPDDPRAGIAFFNAGIIYYNNADFRRASIAFLNAVPFVTDDYMLLEKVRWFLANALLNEGRFEVAIEQLIAVRDMEASFQYDAHELLRMIEPHMVE